MTFVHVLSGHALLLIQRDRARQYLIEAPGRKSEAKKQAVGAAMDELAIARALHVLAVVLWIGGVAFVTLVFLPAVRRFKTPAERVAFFDAIERRFAWQARVTTLLAGLTGLYMTARLDLWERFGIAAYWWMSAMVAVWLVFSIMLFIVEPLALHRKLLDYAKADPEAAYRSLERMHRILLIAALITIFGAVAGSHGLLLFD